MEQSSGLVITAPVDRAVYLAADDVTAFRELAALVVRRPSVAGPALDLAPFERLAEELDEALANRRDAVIGPAEAECLSLLSDQMALRGTLPLRIRPTCSACGLASEKLVNPDKPKAGRSGEISDAIISTVDMAVEHPVLAVVRLMGGVGKLRAGNVADIAVCERCDGVEFDSPAVTFCPSCRALREESILLTCPDCQAAFRPPARPAFWLTAEQARGRLRLEQRQARLEAAAGEIENSLYAGQKQFLIGSLTPDDDPLGLLRCGRPGDAIRGVAVLLTTKQLIWAYQLMTARTTGGALAWADVVGVRLMGAAGQQSLELHLPDRPALILNRIKGTGVQLSGRIVDFSPAGLHRLACELSGAPFEPWRDPAPVQLPAPVSPSPMPLPVSPVPPPSPPPPPPPRAVPPRPPAPPPPPPAAPPPPPPPPSSPPPRPVAPPQRPVSVPPQRPVSVPPQPPRTAPPPPPPAYMGWYPDPWRQARLRWWDGRRWTEHVQR